MDVEATKILVLCIFACLRITVSFGPLLIKKYISRWEDKSGSESGVIHRKKRIQNILSVILCFGGGILLATCFLHILPEVRDRFEKVPLPHELEHYPLAELLLCCGFFLVYILEEIIHVIFVPSKKSHRGHGHSHGPLPTIPSTNNNQQVKELELAITSLEDSESTPYILSRANSADANITSYEHPDAIKWRKDILSSKVRPSVSQVHLLASSFTLNEVNENDEESENKVNNEMPISFVEAEIYNNAHSNTNGNNNGNGMSNGNGIANGVSNGTSKLNGHNNHHRSSSTPSLDALKHKSVLTALRNFVFVLALSFHGIFEGMAVGLQKTSEKVWILFAAVAVHDCAILFCISMELVSAGTRFLHLICYIVTLSIISPLGIVIGILLTSSNFETPTHQIIVAVLEGLAGGSILYITFFEVLGEQKRKESNGLLKLFFVMIGFAGMVLLEALAGQHDHGEESTLSPNSTAATISLNSTATTMLARATPTHDHAGHSHGR